MTRAPTIGFRRLVDDDLPLLHRWLNEPGVVTWWEGDDVSFDAVVRDYGAGSPDPVEHWIIVVDGRDRGWIQCYAAADFAEADETGGWWELGVPRTAAGVDYLLGEPADRGRGLGSALLRAFTDDVVFGAHPSWTHVCASPLVSNAASWRALANAGFIGVGDFPTEHGPARLMVRPRDPTAWPRYAETGPSSPRRA